MSPQGAMLTPSLDGDGYPRVSVAGRPVAVHVLVALAWHGRPEVLHGDGDKSNSRPSNLRWRSHRENEQDKKENRKLIEDGRGCYPPLSGVTPVTGDVQR